MKKLKRLLSVVLALTMMLSLVVVVSASGEYTITITGETSSDYVYTAYQIFSGVLDESSGTAILSNIVWGSDVTATDALYTALAGISDASGNYPFTLDKTATGTALSNAADVAAALSDYADSSDTSVVNAFADVIVNYITGSGTNSTYDDPNYKIENLSAGYYLVKNTTVPDDGAYTSYILKVVKSVEVATKKSIPQVDKDLDETDANIGDTITYYLTASLPSNLSDYDTYTLKFTDTLGDGLTYVGVSAVYVYTTESDAQGHTETNCTLVYDDDSNYVIDASSAPTTGGGSFTVTLNNVKALTSDNSGTVITVDSTCYIQVVFTATLNSNAVIASTGNPNEVYLEYSNNPNDTGTGKTEPDKVITWTYELDVTKEDGDSKALLEGAKFVLYRIKEGTTDTKEYVVVDSNSKVVEWTENAYDSGESTVASVLESNDSGLFSVIGLDVGTYYLEEIEAPASYNLLDAPVTIVISASHVAESGTWLSDDELELGTLSATNAEINDTTKAVEATIDNNQGSSLPETGGIGTTIFYVVGGVLILGAVVLLITKKRMSNEEK